jgi:hypothetical protein
MTRSLGLTNDVPWASIMPSSEYKSFVKNLVNCLTDSFFGLSKDYLVDTWVPCGRVLDALKPAKIATQSFKELLEKEGSGNGALESFKPGGGGYTSPVVYDRFGTRTGRLTVESGPNILTLRKDMRKLLRSHFQDGSIISLDFSSLEARIILAEAGGPVTTGDIYTKLSQDLFDGRIARDVVKVAVLSELYGASRSTLGYRLDMGGADLDSFIDRVRGVFKTSELKSRIKKDLSATGAIHNRYGRPLFLDDTKAENLFLNTYIQSTGVDVSMLGFGRILDRLGSDGIRPLFVLHDALILDVRSDRLEDVSSIDVVDVPGYECCFPLKAEII